MFTIRHRNPPPPPIKKQLKIMNIEILHIENNVYQVFNTKEKAILFWGTHKECLEYFMDCCENTN